MVRKKTPDTEAKTDLVEFPPKDEPPPINPEDYKKRPYPSERGYWRDNEAGVRIQEDRTNNLSTILFKEKAPAAAIKLLGEHGYVRENDHAYTKEIDYLRRRELRAEAEQLVTDVTNIVRAEKGLEPKKSFYISRS